MTFFNLPLFGVMMMMGRCLTGLDQGNKAVSGSLVWGLSSPVHHPTPCIWTAFIFSLYMDVQHAAVQHSSTGQQQRHVATRLLQNSFSFLNSPPPNHQHHHHPLPPLLLLLVSLKTLCPMAWANMFGHLSCEPAEWQDPRHSKPHTHSTCVTKPRMLLIVTNLEVGFLWPFRDILLALFPHCWTIWWAKVRLSLWSEKTANPAWIGYPLVFKVISLHNKAWKVSFS